MLHAYEAFFSAMLSVPFEAANLADRNLRYVIHYGHNRGKGRVFLVLKAIRDLMNCVGYDPVKAERIRAEYINSKGAEGYGFLFERIYGKFFSKKFASH